MKANGFADVGNELEIEIPPEDDSPCSVPPKNQLYALYEPYYKGNTSCFCLITVCKIIAIALMCL